MVAVIKTGHSLRRVLAYNENKIKEGVARCISASNYPIDHQKLSFHQKLSRLVNQAALNANVTRNSVHVSLNFDPTEQLSDEQLQSIADTYMRKIGFAGQPYLVYQHFDAGHPHLHIVSVKVRADGSRIDTQNIGRNQSEKARKEIEASFGLVRAETRKAENNERPAYTTKVQYGRSASRRAIAAVLDAVLDTYKYTSLHELNAVLRGYNVMADRCGEASRIYQNKGLLYRILDEEGNPVGVPIKASSFYNQPTLAYLEKRFAMNAAGRQSYKARIKNAVDLALLKRPKQPFSFFIQALKKEGIAALVRQNADGIIYGITYVDHRTKCVFNGSAIGKPYSAKGIWERCMDEDLQAGQRKNSPEKQQGKTQYPAKQNTEPTTAHDNQIVSLLEPLLQPEKTPEYIPFQFRKKGGRKRSKRKNKRL